MEELVDVADQKINILRTWDNGKKSEIDYKYGVFVWLRK